ncbi:MAG: molybdenum cofactor guanylyltransferase [Geobacteraceae bacterium]|nr:molybdenum cofactor guanylyltransferase [Geobacteraceae bacterium]
MGSNKALLPYRGGRFIESIHRQLAGLLDEVLLVTNTPEQYRFLGCRMVADLHPGLGALAGLQAGLHHAATGHIFAVACDMPYLNDTLVRALLAQRQQADVIIPEGDQGLEPLHAVYGKACLPHMEAALLAGRRRLISFFPRVRVRHFECTRVAAIDPGFDSFRNINTPDDYFALRRNENGDHESVYPVCTYPALQR